jgi:hypothetical protein
MKGPCVAIATEELNSYVNYIVHDVSRMHFENPHLNACVNASGNFARCVSYHRSDRMQTHFRFANVKVGALDSLRLGDLY